MRFILHESCPPIGATRARDELTSARRSQVPALAALLSGLLALVATTATAAPKSPPIGQGISVTWTITATADSGGLIAPSGDVVVNQGDSQSFTITPDAACWSISDVVVDGGSVGPVSSYQFENVTANHSIHAVFSSPTYHIDAVAGANGSIDPSESVPVGCQKDETFTFTPNACYHVSDVLVDGVSVGAAPSYTFTSVVADHNISVSFALDHHDITASAGPGGVISPNGVTAVDCGDGQAYTITPDACYSIADVLVDGNSVGAVATYTFSNVTAPHTIAASFNINSFNIDASAAAGGSIGPSGLVAVNCGDNQTFTITPDACYHILDVTVDGVSTGPNGSYPFLNVTTNHTIAATFALDVFHIDASVVGNGQITPSGNVGINCGSDQTFTITSDACNSISDVLVDGVSVGAVASYTFTNVVANHNIVAQFVLETFTISPSAGAGGTISPGIGVNVDCGTNQAFTITPDACYSIADVMVDGVSVGAVGSYLFTNVTATHTIDATFALASYTITSSGGAGGSISPSGTVPVGCGDAAAFTITPDPCYTIQDVLVDGVSIGPSPTHTFNNVQANHTISATFLAGSVAIDATPGSGGTITPEGHVVIACGGDQTFTITPDACQVIQEVLVDGTPIGPVTSYTFTNVVQNHNIVATFLQTTFTVTSSAGAGGTIGPPGPITVACGNDQSFAMTPNTCFKVEDVVVDGVSVGPTTLYTFTNVQAAHTIDATFSQDYDILASAGTGGTITPSGTVHVVCATDQNFTIQAASCHTIVDVLVDGVSVGAVTSYDFLSVGENHTIAASFAFDTYTITASASADGSIAPSGGVSVNCGADQSFTITADACGQLADVLVDGVSVGAVTSYTFTNVGANHTIAASFTSTSVATTTLLDPQGVVVCGQSVTLNAHVTPNTAAGTVEFFVDGSSVGTAPVVAGDASVNPGAPDAGGTYILSAVYTPSGCFLGSASNEDTVTVGKAPTSMTLVSDTPVGVYGQPIMFTATLTPSTATGNVVFRDSLAIMGSAPVVSGVATLSKPTLSVGAHTRVFAVFSGDACYQAVNSDTIAQPVNRAPTSLNLSTNINPSSYGQLVTISATVTPAGPMGTVSFYDGGNLIGMASLGALTGMATLNIGNFLPGDHALTAVYPGESRYQGSSTPSPYTQTVTINTSSVELTSDVNPSQLGQMVTFTATVTPGDGGGTVDFVEGSTVVATVPIGFAGVTTWQTSALSVGTHVLHANYYGSSVYSTSSSPDYNQDVVGNTPPTVTVTYPNGGEDVTVGTMINLAWTATDNTFVTMVTLELSRDNGTSWETIASNIANSGTFLWTVTGPGTNTDVNPVYTAVFRVTAQDDAGVFGSDYSNTPFSVFDQLTGVVITQLDAVTLDEGVSLRWAFNERDVFTSFELERAPTDAGPWANVPAEVTAQQDVTVATDRTTEAGATYYYRLIGTTSVGTQATFGPVKGTAGSPREFALSSAWPNPSHGPVSMTFAMPRATNVRLSVLDIQGREVAVLFQGEHKAGRFQVDWDGRGERGTVPAGLYFVRFVTPEKKLTSRIAITP